MLWLGLLAIIGAAAGPEPAYLTCEWTNASGTTQADVAIDEANQRATISVVGGRIVTRPALFTPTEVTVVDEPMTWRFSRTDLTFRRTPSFMPATDPGNAGACKIAPKPAKRAF